MACAGTSRTTASASTFRPRTDAARASSRGALRPAHGAQLAAAAAAAEEAFAAVRFEAGDRGAGRHRQRFEDLAAVGVDAAQFTFVTFPGAVPEVAIDPAHAGDETVRFDRAQDLADRKITRLNSSH